MTSKQITITALREMLGNREDRLERDKCHGSWKKTLELEIAEVQRAIKWVESIGETK